MTRSILPTLWMLLAASLVPSCGDDGGDGNDAGSDADGDGEEAEAGCPEDMVRIPAGPFVMGSDPAEGQTNEEPEHVVTLSEYCIDRTEVNVEGYRACVRAGACVVIDGEYRPLDFPVHYIDFARATAYCAWVGKRLPTEAEWEKAARGGCEIVEPEGCGEEDERAYPWGEDAATCDHANFEGCIGATDGTSLRPTGDSPYGLSDMAGNVWEWVADRYEFGYSSCASGCVDPTGPETGDNRILRGGAWDSEAAALRVSLRVWQVPTYVDYGVGFRCALSLQ